MINFNQDIRRIIIEINRETYTIAIAKALGDDITILNKKGGEHRKWVTSSPNKILSRLFSCFQGELKREEYYLVISDLNSIARALKISKDSWFNRLITFMKAEKMLGQKEINEYKRTIKNLFLLAQKARREGILSLEDDELTHKPLLLKRGIEWITDGCEENKLISELENQISKDIAEDYLENNIIKEALIQIYHGETSKQIFENLIHLLGINFAKEVDLQTLFEEVESISYLD